MLNQLEQAFVDYTRPAAIIQQQVGKDVWTLQMLWDDMQVFADVTPVVLEVMETGKIGAESVFKELCDDLVHKFAVAIIEKRDKMVKKEAKQKLRQSKVLRLHK